MYRPFTRIFTLIMASVMLLSACNSPAAPAAAPDMAEPEIQTSPAAMATVDEQSPAATTEPTQVGFTVTDALGREVYFETAPQRIVLTGRAWFQLVDAIYAFPASDERLIAIGDRFQGSMDIFPLLDSNFAAKTLLDRDASAEQIAALQPDLVMMKSYLAESQGKPLEVLGIPVIYLDLETPEQYQRDLQTIGQIFQDDTRTSEVLAYFQGMAGQVTSKTAGLSDADKPSVLLIYYDDRDGEMAVQVPPLSWLQTSLVEMAGGRPVWRDIELGNGWTKVNFEQIAVWNPDKIFVVAYNKPVAEAVGILQDDPQWQALDAVKNGEMYAFPGAHFSWDQPDTHWVLGLNWLATRIQPALFADLNMEEETRQFYATLYGLDEATYLQNIQPRITGDYP